KSGTAKTWAIDKILDAKERDVFQPFVKLFGANFSCVGPDPSDAPGFLKAQGLVTSGLVPRSVSREP
ncbi:MAG: hypothetical protein LBF66_02865, partial [Holosporales bacterium]|nr:hypothetical protein [Holosporales bacterium]